ncbi:hypothetical protein NAH68_27870, partial [Klebsiella pneumoniae]
GGKNSLNRLIRCVCGKKIGPDPRNFNQRVSLGRNDLLIRTFPSVYSNSAIAIRILKYILILPWQRQKYSYMKFILRGISHGIKGISGKYH